MFFFFLHVGLLFGVDGVLEMEKFLKRAFFVTWTEENQNQIVGSKSIWYSRSQESGGRPEPKLLEVQREHCQIYGYINEP